MVKLFAHPFPAPRLHFRTNNCSKSEFSRSFARSRPLPRPCQPIPRAESPMQANCKRCWREGKVGLSIAREQPDNLTNPRSRPPLQASSRLHTYQLEGLNGS
ncbi:uncharacterized protein PV06_08593 [Exophiala oligosperma]|uniref:Uncharacterized protein n=1 Tax=Exophiala oligosperma TaxID=215243 RepID=A0A0D2DAB7_9EURO|nr:uncharacterized protein PV06_08593 [Exophiala oligosperma]KIW40038.1 hypothetical protein PV06_08593 [Exophiala oligosperma]